MSDIDISSSNLLAKNPAKLPVHAKDFSRYSFWQYTRLELADLILSAGSFRISNLNGMNDLDEAKMHETNRDRVFVLCFCNSDTEKIPMWYLYSGLTGKGAAIGFTPGNMLKWLKSIQRGEITIRGIKAGQKKDEGKVLMVENDIDFKFGWVYYQPKAEPQRLFYRNKWYCTDDVDAFQKDNYFIKYYPWEYEREYRLVFITEEPYEAIFVDIPEEINNAAKVKLAPELTEAEVKNHRCLKKIGQSLKPAYSGLSIRMNLFNRNKQCLLDYIKGEIKLADPSITADEICKLVKDAGLCPDP